MQRHQRHYLRVVPSTPMYISIGAGPVISGRVIDFSLGGIAFEHAGSRDAPVSRRSHVLLFVERDDILITGMPGRVIYDVPVQEEACLPCFHKQTRRCGIAFEELYDDQVEKLTCLLHNRSCGLA